ncbi:MAG: hypothetical protein ACJAVJ_000166, partial [Planctomycetota bacterium]
MSVESWGWEVRSKARGTRIARSAVRGVFESGVFGNKQGESDEFGGGIGSKSKGLALRVGEFALRLALIVGLVGALRAGGDAWGERLLFRQEDSGTRT